MPFITWNDKLSVSVAAMDLQHQQLVAVVNKLHEAMTQGRAKDQINSILRELVNYTKRHFAAEESFMRSIKYPNYDAHKRLHDELTRKVIEYQTRIEKGELVTPNTLLNFLHLWLINHIQEEDKQYAGYVKMDQQTVKV